MDSTYADGHWNDFVMNLYDSIPFSLQGYLCLVPRQSLALHYLRHEPFLMLARRRQRTARSRWSTLCLPRLRS